MPRKHVPKTRTCEWCGNVIGKERGGAAKTCSPECQRERNNDKEKKRYAQVKDTPEWKATRASYVEVLKTRAATDPEFAEKLRDQNIAAMAKFHAKVNADPARRASVLQYKRERERIRLARINSDPKTRAAYLARQRQWYHSLSPDEREKIFYKPRRRRDYERQILMRLDFASTQSAAHTAINIAKRGLNYSFWSGNELAYMREHYANTRAADIAAHLNRSIQAIHEKASELGLRAESGRGKGGDGGWHAPNRRAWLLQDDEILKKWYGLYTAEELAYAMDRTLKAVRKRVFTLGLKSLRGAARLRRSTNQKSRWPITHSAA